MTGRARIVGRRFVTTGQSTATAPDDKKVMMVKIQRQNCSEKLSLQARIWTAIVIANVVGSAGRLTHRHGDGDHAWAMEE